jgi:hypothetical protein
MKVVVTRHYPAWKLPADLRENLDPSALVTVIVEEKESHPTIPALRRGSRQMPTSGGRKISGRL